MHSLYDYIGMRNGAYRPRNTAFGRRCSTTVLNSWEKNGDYDDDGDDYEEKQEDEIQWIVEYKKPKRYHTILHQTKFAVFRELFELDCSIHYLHQIPTRDNRERALNRRLSNLLVC